MQLRKGMVITSKKWKEPLNVENVIDEGGYVIIEGRFVHSGKYEKQILFPEDLENIELVSTNTFTEDPQKVFLALESKRFRYAAEYDPLLAMSVSKIAPLPHQIEAVYGRILKMPRIRYLIADDPSAGKTIMAGLVSLLEGKKKMSQLQEAIRNYSTLKLTVIELEKGGYIKTREVVEGRKIIYVSLTPKGKVVAEKLKEAENVAMMSPEELEERRKNIHWIVDINTYVDHITAYDIHNGKKEIFNIWLKPNSKYLLLYCDKCDSYDCYHIDWALHDPVIGPELREKAKKKGLKIKNLEE